MVMSKTLRPCQAKDPNLCPYHGTRHKLDKAIHKLASDPTNQELLKDILTYQAKLEDLEKQGVTEETLAQQLENPPVKDYSFTPQQIRTSIDKRFGDLKTFITTLTNTGKKHPIKLHGIGDVRYVEYSSKPTNYGDDYGYETDAKYLSLIFTAGGRYFQLNGFLSSWEAADEWEDTIQEVTLKENINVNINATVKPLWLNIDEEK